VPLGHVASGVASNTQVKKKKIKKIAWFKSVPCDFIDGPIKSKREALSLHDAVFSLVAWHHFLKGKSIGCGIKSV